jgi:hypothetical protein
MQRMLLTGTHLTVPVSTAAGVSNDFPGPDHEPFGS